MVQLIAHDDAIAEMRRDQVDVIARGQHAVLRGSRALLTCTYRPAIMYMMSQPRAKWTIARARQQLPALIGAAAREPQRVYKRDRLVAAVVSPELAESITAAKPRLADSLEELQRLCAQEHYELPDVPRRDRPDPMKPRRRKR